MSIGHHPVAECARCGRRRQVHTGRVSRECLDCRYVRITPSPDDELTGGKWVSRGGVQVWVESRCHCGETLAGTSCERCLTWAEKDARLHAEARQRAANRGLIWDVLAMRNEQELMSA